MSAPRHQSYVSRMYRYYAMNYPKAEAQRKIVAAYRNLPFVERVVFPAEGYGKERMAVYMEDEHFFTVGLDIPESGYRPPQPASRSLVEMQAANTRRQCVQALNDGGVLFLDGTSYDHANIVFRGGKRIRSDLAIFIHVCNTERTAKETLVELQRLKVMNIAPSPLWGRIVGRLTVPSELENRIRTELADPLQALAAREAQLDREAAKKMRKAASHQASLERRAREKAEAQAKRAAMLAEAERRNAEGRAKRAEYEAWRDAKGREMNR